MSYMSVNNGATDDNSIDIEFGKNVYDYSYIVAIVYSPTTLNLCNGVLISKIHVLIVPQCFYFEKNYPKIQIQGFTVYLRILNSEMNYGSYPILAIDVHPDFSIDEQPSINISNDIGVALVNHQVKNWIRLTYKLGFIVM